MDTTSALTFFSVGTFHPLNSVAVSAPTVRMIGVFFGIAGIKGGIPAARPPRRGGSRKVSECCGRGLRTALPVEGSDCFGCHVVLFESDTATIRDDHACHERYVTLHGPIAAWPSTSRGHQARADPRAVEALVSYHANRAPRWVATHIMPDCRPPMPHRFAELEHR